MGSIVITTQPIPRKDLAKYFPDNPRLVRLLENLAQDVVVNIPATVNPDTVTLNDVQEAVGAAQALGQAAQALAIQALAAALQSTDGPPTGSDLLARVAALERAVAELSEKPTP